MARASLRRYDVQAKVSLWFSCAAILGMAALLFLLFRNFHSDVQAIMYRRGSLYAPIVFCVTALTLLLAGTGAVMGANSAGQKRNQLTRRSWLAFFLGAGTAMITIISFYAFWVNRFAQN